MSFAKYLRASIAGLFLISTLQAQDIPGYVTSEYAGISGFNLNPASIADSRYKFDMSLAGGGYSIYNDYLSLNGGFYKEIWKPSGEDFATKYIVENPIDKPRSVDMSANLQFPSFMITLGRTSAIAFNSRLRYAFNIDRMNKDLANLAYNGLDVPSLYNIRLKNDQFSVNTMLWQEFGLGYAQVLKAKGQHFFKVGGQIKWVQGISAAYFYARNLNYEWKNSDTLSLFTAFHVRIRLRYLG
jgi:hypothetical protein